MTQETMQPGMPDLPPIEVKDLADMGLKEKMMFVLSAIMGLWVLINSFRLIQLAGDDYTSWAAQIALLFSLIAVFSMVMIFRDKKNASLWELGILVGFLLVLIMGIALAIDDRNEWAWYLAPSLVLIFGSLLGLVGQLFVAKPLMEMFAPKRPAQQQYQPYPPPGGYQQQYQPPQQQYQPPQQPPQQQYQPPQQPPQQQYQPPQQPPQQQYQPPQYVPPKENEEEKDK